MTIRTVFTTFPLILIGGMATAQNVEFLSYGANYTNFSVDGESIDILSFGGGIDYRRNGFVFNGDIIYADSETGFDVSDLGIRVGYFATPDLALYAGLDHLGGTGIDQTAYNIGGEYTFGAVTVSLAYQDSGETGFDAATTFYGSYQISDELEVALGVTEIDGEKFTVLGADFDMGSTELFATYTDNDGIGIFAVNGNYDFGNGFRAGGGYVDFDGAVDIVSVRGGYEVSEDLWVDLSYDKIDGGFGDDADVIGLSISFETGRETLLIDRAETAQIESLGLIGNLLLIGG